MMKIVGFCRSYFGVKKPSVFRITPFFKTFFGGVQYSLSIVKRLFRMKIQMLIIFNGENLFCLAEAAPFSRGSKNWAFGFEPTWDKSNMWNN